MRPNLVLLPEIAVLEPMQVETVKSPQMAAPAKVKPSSPLHMWAPLPTSV
jgi:hypothetical protein